ncbi:hypothetical protein [Streptomyces sp. NPDC051079]|uniref:hypothetical protein n=1 Tax=Streptomyces sp. NPDC051079 TaxID=3155043 RepID=UPI00344D62A0
MKTGNMTAPTWIQRVGVWAGKTFTWLAYGLFASLVIGWATLVILGNFVWDHQQDDDKNPTPAATATATSTPIFWILEGRGCQDGWPSPSIGKRGACSHHGGVVTYYVSSTGALRTTCGREYQPKTLERARELADGTGSVSCDFQP